MRKYTALQICLSLVTAVLLLSGCKKLLEIDPPLASITTDEMFANNRQAELAISGVYSKMIHGTAATGNALNAESYFASGLSTFAGGLSSDELVLPATYNAGDLSVVQNKITTASSRKSDAIWNSAYRTVFDATAVIEGIEASASSELVQSVRDQLTGEALALRAFSYFYLVNNFGDLPLVLSSDSKKNLALSRSPVAKVYEQIIADLVKARSLMSSDFSFVNNNEKVRVNKWFAEALLARVYLYTHQYQLAIASATEVINQRSLFDLETDLAKVFLKGSKEAIFQLKQNGDDPVYKNGTPEGIRFLNNLNLPNISPDFRLSDQLLGSFEPNDKRKTTWVGVYPPYSTAAKYKNGQGLEYYVVMRLAEQYLIRAEAIAKGTPGNVKDAITDINLLRKRANIPELDENLPVTTVIDTIAHERRIELFAEWGHRWFDLKRTGKAAEVLPQLPYKQPWWGDYQLLYPIPDTDIKRNGQLEQNPEYNTH
ncbi:MAG: RagB/SusD family nutrient uptake outer membrane protein [Chitinophagaceae bacterium]|nr:RagB/SusD family nutrient uptake outer membrane protein [Chitinophagaceae bacterium]